MQNIEPSMVMQGHLVDTDKYIQYLPSFPIVLWKYSTLILPSANYVWTILIMHIMLSNLQIYVLHSFPTWYCADVDLPGNSWP
jgi:hypothetical protein